MIVIKEIIVIIWYKLWFFSLWFDTIRTFFNFIVSSSILSFEYFFFYDIYINPNKKSRKEALFLFIKLIFQKNIISQKTKNTCFWYLEKIIKRKLIFQLYTFENLYL